MASRSYELIAADSGDKNAGHSIKMWTQGVPVEAAARQQLLDTASLPFIFGSL